MPGSTGPNSRDGSPADPVGDLDRAEEMCLRAIKIDPDDDYVLSDYADFLADVRGDRSQAKDICRQTKAVRRQAKAALKRR